MINKIFWVFNLSLLIYNCGNLRCVGLLGNVLGLLGMLRNVIGLLRYVLGLLGMPFRKVLGVPHRRKPPHLLPYKLWSQGSSVPPSFHIWNLVVHYSHGFTAYKAATGGGVFFDVGLLGPCEKACRGCLGRCKACLGRCEACRGRPRTLPSMPRSCQASLHILGSHKSQCW